MLIWIKLIFRFEFMPKKKSNHGNETEVELLRKIHVFSFDAKSAFSENYSTAIQIIR